MENKRLAVSKEFIECFRMFNVIKQVDKIKNLNRKERILLLTLVVDTFSEENPVVIENIKEFKEELELIYDLQQDKECTDTDLLELAQETDEKYIDTDILVDMGGEKLPSSYTEEEALRIRRDISISGIIS